MTEIVKCPVGDCNKDYPVHSLVNHVRQVHKLPDAKILFRRNAQDKLYGELRLPSTDFTHGEKLA